MPVVDTTELSGEISLEMAHESSEISCCLTAEQQMKVVAEEDVVVKLDNLSVNMEGVSQDTSADVSDVVVRGKESEALDATRGNVVSRPRG